MFQVLWILLCLIKLSFQNCEESTFGTDSVILTCANGTQTFPIPKKNVISLRCLDCNIPVLDEKTILKKFIGDTFNLSYSHVQVISANAFRSFRRTMRRFLFINNEFNYIAPKLFNNFSIIDEVNFKNSRITQLDYGVFNDSSISHLDLSENLLSNVTGIFDGLKTTMLNLSSNRIKDIPRNTFDKMTFGLGRVYLELSILDLSNNVLQRIYANTFKSFERSNAIRILILSKNFITTIESKTFLNCSLMQMLTLNDNLISQLNSESFRGLTSLLNMDLSKNQIRKIPTSLFADLQRLESLDLSQNVLSDLDPTTFSGLQNLKALNLSHNNLRVFEDAHLFPLITLVSLDITDIKIHTINLKAILQHHWRLVNLVINDNFWICKDLTKMFKQLGRLHGFNFPAQHFDVSNLHGIACSKEELKTYETLTFTDFLNIIAQEPFDPNSFIDDDLPYYKIMENVVKNIAIVKSMSIVIALVLIVLFLQFVIRLTLMCLQHYNILKNSKFTFFYDQNQDTVKVLP